MINAQAYLDQQVDKYLAKGHSLEQARYYAEEDLQGYAEFVEAQEDE